MYGSLRDTVASVGLITSKHLPLTASNFSVKTFRQALALDERRVKFKPNMWHRSSKVCQRFTKQRAPPPSHPMLVASGAGSLPVYVRSTGQEDLHAVDRTRRADEKTDVREVWFAGCHSGEKTRARDWISNQPLNPSSITCCSRCRRWKCAFRHSKP